MFAGNEFVVRANLIHHSGSWHAHIIGRPVFSRSKAQGATVEQTSAELATIVRKQLPMLTAEERDDVDLDQPITVLILAMTSRVIPADAAVAPSPIPAPREPGKHCLTVPFEERWVGSRVRMQIDHFPQDPLGGLSTAGPTASVAEAGLVAVVRRRILEEPFVSRGITSLRMQRTRRYAYQFDAVADQRRAS